MIVSKAVKDSNKKLQDENFALKESNRLIRIEKETLSCNLMMAEIDHSRLEDAMDAELRGVRKEASDLRQNCTSKLKRRSSWRANWSLTGSRLPTWRLQ